MSWSLRLWPNKSLILFNEAQIFLIFTQKRCLFSYIKHFIHKLSLRIMIIFPPDAPYPITIRIISESLAFFFNAAKALLYGSIIL